MPGDVSDLPGPLDFNVEALTAGEAVLIDGLAGGLVPTVVRSAGADSRRSLAADAVRWRLLPTDLSPNRGPGLAEADQALAGAVREATEVLDRLDVAGMGPASAAALAELRGDTVGSDLPPGYPDRAREVLRRAYWLTAVVALATEEGGSAVSAAESLARSAGLDPVGRAARLGDRRQHTTLPVRAPTGSPALPR